MKRSTTHDDLQALVMTPPKKKQRTDDNAKEPVKFWPGDYCSGDDRDYDMMVLAHSYDLGPGLALRIANEYNLMTVDSRFTYEGWLFPKWLLPKAEIALCQNGFIFGGDGI